MSSFRLSGISSGLDTEALINQLVQIERRPVALMEQKQSILKLKKNLWQETNMSLSALFEKVKALIKPETFQVKATKTSDDKSVTVIADKNAVAGQYDVKVTNLAKAHQIAGSKQDSSTTALGISGTFTISDGLYTASIEVLETDTLNTIMTRINSAQDLSDPTEPKSLRVSAAIVDNTLILQHDYTGTAATGTDNTITLTDSANVSGSTAATEVLESLGLVNDTKAIANELQQAEDAHFTVNSISVTRAGNTGLSDVITGVTLNLLKEDPEATITLTVANDTDAMMKSVKDFVNAYNSSLEFINNKLSEEPWNYSNGRLAEKETQTPRSEAEMKKGLLRGDAVLIGIKNQLRVNVSEPIVGLTPFDSLSDIGITTSSEDFGKSGKLVIDEEKLRAALEKNPEAVANLFIVDSNQNGSVDSGENGIAAKLYNQLDSLLSTKNIRVGSVVVPKGTLPARMQTFDKEIRDYDNEIAAFERLLEKREENLWKQFTEMEKALSTLNNQATWLAGQLANLGGWGGS